MNKRSECIRVWTSVIYQSNTPTLYANSEN